jgi:hypothetical protein
MFHIYMYCTVFFFQKRYTLFFISLIYYSISITTYQTWDLMVMSALFFANTYYLLALALPWRQLADEALTNSWQKNRGDVGMM